MLSYLPSDCKLIFMSQDSLKMLEQCLEDIYIFLRRLEAVLGLNFSCLQDGCVHTILIIWGKCQKLNAKGIYQMVLYS